MTGKKYKILLAEDDSALSYAYKEALEREGFSVSIATDGQEALDHMNAQKPDLLLLDLLMPIKTGVEVLQAKEASEALKDIPVVIVTNSIQETLFNEKHDFTIDGYLVKSNVSLKEVVNKVKEILKIPEE